MKNNNRSLKLIVFIFGLIFSKALIPALKNQVPEDKQPHTVPKIQDEIHIDGILEEPAWEKALKIRLPYEYMPGDNTPAPVETECLITYSQSKLYVAFRCFDPEPAKIQAHLMDRDSIDKMNLEDYISLYFDTFNDQRHAFHFRVNPLGVQADALYNEMGGDLNFSWDAIWKSAGKITDWGYAVEIAVPFSRFRFPKRSGELTWGFTAERAYPRNIQRLMSANARDRSNSCFLCQAHKLIGFTNASAGHSIELAPTLTTQRTDQLNHFPGEKMEAGKIDVQPGISVKWGVQPNMTLNFTVNPDFSQVEADVAQLDVNTRFALYYPEKRPFFLEGADFFRAPLEIVFTRTVADPLWGAKITRKTGKNAIGFFTAQDQICNLLIPSSQSSMLTSLDANVLGGVLRYRRDVGKSSSLGVLFTTRNSEDYFNHVMGADGFLRLNRSNHVRFQYLHSISKYPDDTAAAFNQKVAPFGGGFFLGEFTHASRNWFFQCAYDDISPDFRADFGFIFRVGVRYYAAALQRHFYGKSGGWFDLINITLIGYKMVEHGGNMVEQSFSASLDYSGPMQTAVSVKGEIKEELFNGVTQESKFAEINASFKPFNGIRIGIYGKFGEAFDYTNVRLANITKLQPNIDMAVGKHLRLNFSHDYEYLFLGSDKIYKVNLSQARLVYNFNLKTFIRVALQYQHLEQNPNLYLIPVEPQSQNLFTQFLFSYKINPQTILFIGYSDNSIATIGIPLTRVNRTFFLKLGYALGL
jgi:hypothetical protein